MSCAIRCFSSFGLVIFILSLISPWYFEFTTIEFLNQDHYDIYSVNFWYFLDWNYCSNCNGNIDLSFWDFGESTNTRLIFGISWCSALLATISTLVVVITGKAGGGLITVISSITAIVSLIFLPMGIDSDSILPCETGPCDSFFGSESTNNLGYYWGPNIGWFLAIIGCIYMTIVFWAGCCLSILKKINSSDDDNNNHPNIYHQSEKSSLLAPTYNIPTNTNGNFYTSPQSSAPIAYQPPPTFQAPPVYNQ